MENKYIDLNNGYSFKKEEIVLVEYNMYSQKKDNRNSYLVHIDVVLKNGYISEMEFLFQEQLPSFFNYFSIFTKDYRSFEELCQSIPNTKEVEEERKLYLDCIEKLSNENLIEKSAFEILRTILRTNSQNLNNEKENEYGIIHD